MRKHKLILSITILVVIFIILTIKYNGYFISRVMLSHSSRFMYRTINRIIIQQIPRDKRDIATELKFIKRYIYLNTYPYGQVRDDGASWMLIFGEIWCDSAANIFIRLIGPLNIRGYLVFLKLPNGVSPHSVAYCTPGDLTIRDIEYLQKNAVVVDPQNGIIYSSDKGVFSTPDEICRGLTNMPPSLSSHRQYYCNTPQIFTHNEPLISKRNFKWWFYCNIFPFIPNSWLKSYIKIALIINNRIETAERIYYLARVEQLFLNYPDAIEGYAKVINKYPETRWAELASFWKDRISSVKNRFPE